MNLLHGILNHGNLRANKDRYKSQFDSDMSIDSLSAESNFKLVELTVYGLLFSGLTVLSVTMLATSRKILSSWAPLSCSLT